MKNGGASYQELLVAKNDNGDKAICGRMQSLSEE